MMQSEKFPFGFSKSDDDEKCKIICNLNGSPQTCVRMKTYEALKKQENHRHNTCPFRCYGLFGRGCKLSTESRLWQLEA